MTDSDPNPGISVVVNNYNYDTYLEAALDSALEQLRDCDELVVVDDGSSDDSPDILARYARHPLVTVIFQKNQGQMKAVRTGIEAARGDIIALLDSDDYYLPGYLDRLRDIYRANPDIAFVFSAPQVAGPVAEDVRVNRAVLDRMELPAGHVGASRWAAVLFYEYVGVPTSGNSLRSSLARQIITLPSKLDETQQLPAVAIKLLGLSERDAQKFGFSADGVLVRVSSMLGAVKYYENHPWWVYRIHGDNKYASVPKLGRRYLRHKLRNTLLDMATEHFALARRPSARELRAEITARSFGLRLRRRIHIRGRYCLASLTSRGPLSERLSAALVAAGLIR